MLKQAYSIELGTLKTSKAKEVQSISVTDA